MHLLSEGSRLRIYHLTAAGVRLQILLFVCLFVCADFSNFKFCFSRNRQGAPELQVSRNQNIKNTRLRGFYYLSFHLMSTL